MSFGDSPIIQKNGGGLIGRYEDCVLVLISFHHRTLKREEESFASALHIFHYDVRGINGRLEVCSLRGKKVRGRGIVANFPNLGIEKYMRANVNLAATDETSGMRGLRDVDIVFGFSHGELHKRRILEPFLTS